MGFGWSSNSNRNIFPYVIPWIFDSITIQRTFRSLFGLWGDIHASLAGSDKYRHGHGTCACCGHPFATCQLWRLLGVYYAYRRRTVAQCKIKALHVSERYREPVIGFSQICIPAIVSGCFAHTSLSQGKAEFLCIFLLFLALRYKLLKPGPNCL